MAEEEKILLRNVEEAVVETLIVAIVRVAVAVVAAWYQVALLEPHLIGHL